MFKQLLNYLVFDKSAIAFSVLFSIACAVSGYILYPESERLSNPFGFEFPFSTPILHLLHWGMIVLIATFLGLLDKMHRFMRESSNLPFILPLTLMSCTLFHHPSIREAAAGFVFSLSLLPFFKSYMLVNASKELFTCTLFIATAALLEPRVYLLMPIFFIGYYLFKSLTLRSSIAALLGMLTPIWLAFAGITIVTGQLPNLIPLINFFSVAPVQLSALSVVGIVLLIITLLTFITAFGYLQTKSRGDKLLLRIFLQFSTLVLAACLLIGYFIGGDYQSFLFLFFIAATPLFSYYFTESRTRFTAFHFILFIGTYITYMILSYA